MRPPGLPPAERFAHGTCARYVTGCRCDDCRCALREYARKRSRKVRDARADVKPNDLPPLYVTIYRKARWRGRYPVQVLACPGTGGRPCVNGGSGFAAWLHGTWLRTGERVCTACVDRTAVWNGLVPADRVREHLLALREKGVGYKAVAAACDVHPTRLNDIIRRKRHQLRADKERRILAVDEGARADGAQVPAKRSFAIIDELRAMGFTWGRLSLELGFKSPTGAHCLRHGKAVVGSVGNGGAWVRTTHPRDEVLARTALRIEKLYRRVIAGELQPVPRFVDGAETWRLVDELLKGFSQKDLAARVGLKPTTLSERHARIRPSTAAAVRKLYDELLAAHREGGPLPDGWQTSANPPSPMGAEEWMRGGWSTQKRDGSRPGRRRAAKKREDQELRKLARRRRAA